MAATREKTTTQPTINRARMSAIRVGFISQCDIRHLHAAGFSTDGSPYSGCAPLRKMASTAVNTKGYAGFHSLDARRACGVAPTLRLGPRRGQTRTGQDHPGQGTAGGDPELPLLPIR